jgi:hypothetical protein
MPELMDWDAAASYCGLTKTYFKKPNAARTWTELPPAIAQDDTVFGARSGTVDGELAALICACYSAMVLCRLWRPSCSNR